MRIATTTHKIYKWDEMPDDVKQKAIEKYHDINVDHDWWNFAFEDWKRTLLEAGYENVEIGFSGFWSQGDGASFTADVDVEKWLKVNKLGNKYRSLLEACKQGYIHVYIRKNGRYEHEMTMYLDDENECQYADFYSMDQVDKIEAQLQEVEDKILEDARKKAREIYKSLEKEYDYLTAEEAILDTFEANEYEFEEDGSITSL